GPAQCGVRGLELADTNGAVAVVAVGDVNGDSHPDVVFGTSAALIQERNKLITSILGASVAIQAPHPLWQPRTDTAQTLAIGVIAFDPQDANIMYVGTGSNSSSDEGGPAIGLLKSVDGGRSFQLLGARELTGYKLRDIVAMNRPATGVTAEYDAEKRVLTVYFEPNIAPAVNADAIIAAINAVSTNAAAHPPVGTSIPNA